MSEPRDREVERLLREYQADLQRQAPRADLLARLHEEQRRVRPAKVLWFPSRRLMGGLAVAASLLVTVAVFRPRPGAAPVTAEAVKKEAAALAAEGAAEVAAPAVSGGTGAAVVPVAVPKRAAKAPEVPSPRPAGLASTAQMAPAFPEAASPGGAMADAAAPMPAARMEGETEARKATEAKRTNAAVEKNGLVLVATVVQEVWDPGQAARVFESAYQRLADGREVRSVATLAEVPALPQQQLQQQQMPLPSTGGMALPRAQNRRLAPVRDPIAQARSRIASPSVSPLAEMVVEGYRCTGTRTVEGERTVDRWHSAELGLDLLTRTTDANGGQVVVRYTRIERR